MLRQAAGNRTYDAAPKGFLIISSGQAEATRSDLVVVQNWFQELNRLMPVH